MAHPAPTRLVITRFVMYVSTIDISPGFRSMLGEEATDETQQEKAWREPQAWQHNQIDQIDTQMMYDIELLLSRFVAKASQLIDNFTTDMVEGWMHV